MVDISLKGAFFSARFLPPNGSTITVSLHSPASKKDLVFNGTVIRGTWATSDHGKLARFGIHFGFANSDLIALINKLNT
jgi:hypothetical protein